MPSRKTPNHDHDGNEVFCAYFGEHATEIINLKERITVHETKVSNVETNLQSRVSIKLFLWLIGTLVGILVVVFGVQLSKLDNVLLSTHSIQLTQVAIQKDVEALKKDRFKDHEDYERFKRSIISDITKGVFSDNGRPDKR